MTRLRVRAFRPADAQAISASLLALGEQRINTFNRRALDTVMAASTRDVATAERELADIQRQLTRFREGRRDIDPRANAAGTQELVGTLEAQLAQARAQASAMAGVLAPDSPQVQALQARIRGLQSQIGSQSGRLTGANAAIAPRLADYEELLLRQSFAAKRYEAARSAQQVARNQAIRQQLFIVPVVEPNLPEKSLYPKRFVLLGSILAGLLVTWGIGWLLVAGIREHAA
jgi:capsular polysaccharide transport system permease protein